MALPDRPLSIVEWTTGFSPEMLQALGHLAVISAQIEQDLHLIYWKHAGLNERSGPVVTDNLNPKRLFEDILKFAAMDKNNANILSDLKILAKEFEELNTRRNHCLHWIWSIAGENTSDTVTLDGAKKILPYKLLKPLYKQAATPPEELESKDIRQLCNECTWLRVRLVSHTMDIALVREGRRG